VDAAQNGLGPRIAAHGIECRVDGQRNQVGLVIAERLFQPVQGGRPVLESERGERRQAECRRPWRAAGG